MDVVQLKDGSVEIIGNHRDLVDLVRDKCGDEIAAKIEECDPAIFDDVYSAYEEINEAYELLDKGEYEENDIECAKILIEKAKNYLNKIL